MKRIRYGFIVLWMLLCLASSATAQVSIGIGLPNVSIEINLPLFPDLVRVEGYPVYYAPQLNANYFFYDGMYWVYQNDNWYASAWYNGPWSLVDPYYVPLFVLRIPVHYYRQPPVYFRNWQPNAPPRWGQHWGSGWEKRRSGWDRWQRSSSPAPAPLPVYQQQYSGDRYPRQVEQQHTIRSQNYSYQPRDTIVHQHFKQLETQTAPAPAQRKQQQEPAMRSPRPEDIQRSAPIRQSSPAVQRSKAPQQAAPQQRAPAVQQQKQQKQQNAPVVQQQKQQKKQKAPVVKQQRQQQPGAAQREQKEPKLQGRGQKSQDKGETKEPNQGQGKEKDEGRGGRGNN